MTTDIQITPSRRLTRDGLDPAVTALLESVRHRIRRYVWIEGAALVVVAMGVSFWVSLGIDWLFEPPASVRILLLAGVAALAGYIVLKMLILRLSVPLFDRRMALLLERRFSRFGDTLVTAVELADNPEHAVAFNSEMLALTGEMARRRAGTIDLDELFNAGPLLRAVVAAAACVLSVVVFAAAMPDALGVWSRRVLALSPELWPRYTHLVIEGFEDGVAKVGRGGSFDVLVKADASMAIPRFVQLRYQSDDGARERVNMSREGDALASGDPFQPFNHTFRRVLSPYTFDVVGGDHRLRELRLEVVDNPTITEMTLVCRFPAYLERSPRDLPVTGVMLVPYGTEMTLHARTNKDLVRAGVEPAGEVDASQGGALELEASADDPRAFSLELGQLVGDRSLLLTLLDTDGIRSREPVRLVLVAVVDESPEVDVRTRGIGSAITPLARVPLEGKIRDDYGIARSWFQYTIDEAEPQSRELAEAPRSRPEVEVNEAFEARDLDLVPGSKLTLVLKAEDTYALTENANVGSSHRFTLDVVTPEALLALLQSRELNLRRRFETVIVELTESRDSLARLEQTAPAEAEDAEGAESDSSAQSTTAQESDQQRALALARLRAERALQNAKKNAGETLGLAESFEQIHDELVNNRVDTDELKTRLRDGIASPLRQIAEEMFPEFERRLEILKDSLGDSKAGGTALNQTQRQADMILIAMQQVLQRMLELESFNEVVDLLRGIIDAQKDVHERTIERRRQGLRELLEEEP